MGRVSIFDSPFLLGFDEVGRTIDRLAKSGGDGYPPYNIEQTGPEGLRITLAVAGFAEEQLGVTVENNQLIVRGRGAAEERDKVYLHRGIAARQFQRAFVLAEGIEVAGATLDKGLLHIDLVRPQPETLVRTVKINAAAGKGTTALDVEASDG